MGVTLTKIYRKIDSDLQALTFTRRSECQLGPVSIQHRVWMFQVPHVYIILCTYSIIIFKIHWLHLVINYWKFVGVIQISGPGTYVLHMSIIIINYIKFGQKKQKSFHCCLITTKFYKTKSLSHNGPENLKNVQAKKTRVIKLINFTKFFLGKFHFLQFQKWTKI